MNENSLVTSFSILVRGPNKENFEKKFYRQCKLGCGPQQREFRKEILQAMQVGDRPQQREFRKEILQAMQVGVWGPTQKLTKSQLTIMCKLGIGPTKRNGFPISTDNASRRGPNTEAVTNDKILLHNKSLVVLYHYCLPFLIVMMHNNLSSNCRIKLYLISNYP